MLRKNYWFTLSFVFAACGVQERGGVLGGTTQTTSSLSAARQILELNADTEAQLNLLARKFSSDESEVISFYEPEPGLTMFAWTGRPNGHSVLMTPTLDTKSTADVWRTIAPGEEFPQPLLEAIGREAAITPSVSAAGEPQSLTNPQDQSPPVQMPLTRDLAYCGASFLSDLIGWQSQAVESGYYSNQHGYGYNNINEIGWGVCPLDNTGTLNVSKNGNYGGSWRVPAGSPFRVWYNPYVSCGWDIICGFRSLCTYQTFNAVGIFTGNSSSDRFAWYAGYRVAFTAYCQ